MDPFIKRFVYVLQRLREPGRHYVGLTSDVPERLAWHNAGAFGPIRAVSEVGLRSGLFEASFHE